MESNYSDKIDLAVRLTDNTVVDSILSAVIKTRSKRVLTPEVLDNNTNEDISRSLSEEFLGFLMDADLAEYKGDDGKKKFKINYEETVEYLISIRNIRKTLDNLKFDSEEGFELLCSVPRTDEELEGVGAVDFNMRNITSILLELFGESEDEVIIVNPFFQDSGVEWLLKGMQQSVRNGADIEILSRSLEKGSINRNAISELEEFCKEEENTELKLYDYHEESEKTPKYTIHAKIIIFDKKMAYIGSANLTEHSFKNKLEIGTIIRGNSVKKLRDLISKMKSIESTKNRKI